MEKYRKKLKNDNILMAMGTVALVIVQVLVFARVIVPKDGVNYTWKGFLSGVTFASVLYFISRIVKNCRALKDEQTLKKLHAADTDERNAAVIAKSQTAAMKLTLVLGIVAVVVVGWFDAQTSQIIMACLVAISMISSLCRMYYNYKY